MKSKKKTRKGQDRRGTIRNVIQKQQESKAKENIGKKQKSIIGRKGKEKKGEGKEEKEKRMKRNKTKDRRERI